MQYHLYFAFFLSAACELVLLQKIDEPSFKAINFAKPMSGRKLNGSVFKQPKVDSEISCQMECVRDNRCLSYNFGTIESNKTSICQLSHSDRFRGIVNFTEDEDILYRGIQVNINFMKLFPAAGDFLKLHSSQKKGRNS